MIFKKCDILVKCNPRSYGYRIYGYPGHDDKNYKFSYEEWLLIETKASYRKMAIEFLIDQ